MKETESLQFTQLIQRAIVGDRDAENELIEAIYGRLRELAKNLLRDGQGSVEATHLVNQAWMKIFHDTQPDIRDRNAFFAYMARALRTLLIDHIKARKRQRVGGHMERQSLDGLVTEFEDRARVNLLTLNEALMDLREEDPRQFRTVELRFFGGMTMKQISDFHNVSLSTTENDWTLARAKLRVSLGPELMDT